MRPCRLTLYYEFTSRRLLGVAGRETNAARNEAERAVADKFDPYREALVVETTTIWPAEFEDWSPGDRAAVEMKLHADAAACSQLEYIRMHTGFCRQITVTPADLARVTGEGN
jgi:hypothetical protein